MRLVLCTILLSGVSKRDWQDVEKVLGSASKAMERKYRQKAEGYTFERIAGIVVEI